MIYYLFRKQDDAIIEFGSFDQAFGIDLKLSYCAVADKENTFPSILLIDFINKRCTSKRLKIGKSTYDIVNVKFYKSKINILYQDSTNQVISFSKNELIDSIPKFVEADPPPSIPR